MRRRQAPADPMQTGQELARQVLAQRKRVAIAQAGSRPRASGTRRTRSVGPAASTGPRAARAGVLVAEGDSWFDYPRADVLKLLEDEHNFDVESVAHKGDLLEDMAYSDGQLDAFTRCIERILRRGEVPKAILISGGGNDIAGDEFALLLNHASSGSPGLNTAVVQGVIDQRLRDACTTILAAVTTVCEALLPGPARVPIIVHGYDYPVPDGRGFWGGWGPFPGPWLEPGFRRKGYGAMPARMAILKSLIDQYNRMLAAVAAQPGFAHVRFVDLRDTLSTKPTDYMDWWANELHPTEDGFRAVVARIREAIP